MGNSVEQRAPSAARHAGSRAANAARPADGPRRTRWIWAICGFLLLAVGLVFGQTARFEFTAYDDGGFVHQNPHVIAGLTLSGLRYALTDGPYGDWYPLTTLSHMLDCQLFGLEPAGHHVTNVLLHGTSSVLLFLVLLRMTGTLWPSAWVAAVFAIHPLHVESVAWIAERRDVLSGLFFMLTLGAYALYAQRPSLARYLAVAVCFALGLMAKPMLVTVPFLLLLLDYWPLGRFRPPIRTAWRLVVEKIPLMALAAASCWVVLVLHTPMQSSRQIDRLSLATRLANAVVSYAAYVVQSFYPAGLSPFYPHLGTGLPVAWVACALALLVAISAVAALCWRRRPYLVVGWLWFLGMLVPVIGLVGAFVHARADRYTYLSQIGLSIALAWTVWSVYQSRQSRRPAPWRQALLAVVSGTALLALALLAWRQTSYWRTNETVWTRAASSTEQNAMAHFCLGGIYAEQGRTDEAIAEIRQALAIDSIARYTIADSHMTLAECLTRQGKTNEAFGHYQQAILISPNNELAHALFAVALARKGQRDRATAEFREALRLNPAFPQARLDFANVLLADGETSQAIDQCREVLEKDPKAVHALVIWGSALIAEGQIDEALPQFKRALGIEPGCAQAHLLLGEALSDRGDSRDALNHFNKAMRLQPDDVPTLWHTAWLLATSPNPAVRDGARAVELARRAVALPAGEEPRVYDALAAALAEVKDFSAALGAAEKAATMALIRDDSALVDAIEQRSGLYRQGLPYREPVPHPPAGNAPPDAEK